LLRRHSATFSGSHVFFFRNVGPFEGLGKGRGGSAVRTVQSWSDWSVGSADPRDWPGIAGWRVWEGCGVHSNLIPLGKGDLSLHHHLNTGLLPLPRSGGGAEVTPDIIEALLPVGVGRRPPGGDRGLPRRAFDPQSRQRCRLHVLWSGTTQPLRNEDCSENQTKSPGRGSGWVRMGTGGGRTHGQTHRQLIHCVPLRQTLAPGACGRARDSSGAGAGAGWLVAAGAVEAAGPGPFLAAGGGVPPSLAK